MSLNLDTAECADQFSRRLYLACNDMNSESLDDMINRLKSIVPSGPGIFGIGLQRQDWRPVWALSKEIQEGFNSGIRYPTKELRQAAWNRFNELRDEASKRANSEREHLRSRSERHKSNIFDQCKGIGYSKLADTLFFFDKTTVLQMKSHGRYLADVMKYLGEHKCEMLGEHKKECFDRIQEIKEQHERFWNAHNQAHETRKGDRVQRIEENLAKNRAMYRHAEEALERFQAKASDLRDKISGSSSEKWIGIWGGWLSETESKIDDIESQLQRIKGWIEENEERLRNNR